ncbi:MAG TPA: glycosyltransferase family A protein [Caulobacteraceae bacterium]|nr:glycosyltransferase family A protein [Caulobacteraceae bacterium]
MADIIERLRAVGVEPPNDEAKINYQALPAGSVRDVVDETRPADNPNTSVSCLMVTRGDISVLRYSLECYARQSWLHRELVLVTDADRSAEVEAFVATSAAPNVRVFGIGPGLTLGDLRNITVARARGEVLMQWDDDDLSDPRRVELAIQVLQHSNAAAAYLKRWLIWWPARGLAAISYHRLWEGSGAIRREHMRTYPAMASREDYMHRRHLSDHHPVAWIDAPLQYVYAVTGRNTYQSSHFEALLAQSPCVFEGDDYAALIALLALRMPILAYETALLAR